MVEVYFGLTDKHIENFECIIQAEIHQKHTQKILITDNKNYSPKIWAKVIKSDAYFLQKGTNFFHNFYFMIKKIKAYRKIINQLKPYKKEEKVRIYLAYIEDILSNYLFFNFHKNAEVIVVEDGVLNYYNHSFKNISKTRFYTKKILSQIFGIPFKKYQGHSSGIEYDKSTMQYLSFPEKAFIPKRVHKLPTQTETIYHFKNNLYILGQENLIQIFGFNEYKKTFFNFIDELKEKEQSFQVDRVYYKPRHQYLDFELAYLQNAFGENRVQILDNDLLAEEDYFKNIQSKYIASMISSALLTIYSRCDEGSKSKLKIIFKPIINNEISRLFEHLNFIKLSG
ncbi:hypothetical protein [Flavobacterium sp. CS20]|jgi:hypothetical protein|uniref:hypothetical protein n=1 Tax=Flavobacterium sp. CS20 TaxID=2775246 RepID=UPI001B39F256|nr:hypothetical protein [Flavobacterium sp. CS20]QTY26400.1 hypothetical protein IGB25_10675 [Flavobacterium sp. CS20]